MVNKNVIKIRKKLDKLDDSLLNIIKRRTNLVDLVIKNKKFKQFHIYKIHQRKDKLRKPI